MRNRLLFVLLALLLLVLVALETSLARSHADGRSRELHAELLRDAERFAGLAQAALAGRSGASSLRSELRGYDELYGIEVLLFDLDEAIVAASRPRTGALPAEVRRAAGAALGGRTQSPPATAWPWRRAPFVVGASAGRDSQILGAVVVVAPTDDVRASVLGNLLTLVAAGLGTLLVTAFVVALPTARWVLRPVSELTLAAQELSEGRSDARVPERDGPRELRGLAAVFNRMSASVSDALARQRAFAADASHQLRNPLTALRLRLENLALYVGPGGEAELGAALEEAERLSETIDMLLRLARAQVTETELAVVDAGAIAAARVAAWRPAFSAAGIPLRLADGPICMARCHGATVEQALDTVLDNARKYGGPAAVDVDVAPLDGEHVRIRVRDRGRGLDDDELALAPRRFWRSPRHQNVDGTGLGLTIAQTLLQAGGAEVRLSRAAPGLVADIVLPAPVGAGQRPASR